MQLSRRVRAACIAAIVALALWRGVQVAAWMYDYAASYDAGMLLSRPHEAWLEPCAINAGYRSK
jgi:hypothetical protein